MFCKTVTCNYLLYSSKITWVDQYLGEEQNIKIPPPFFFFNQGTKKRIFQLPVCYQKKIERPGLNCPVFAEVLGLNKGLNIDVNLTNINIQAPMNLEIRSQCTLDTVIFIFLLNFEHSAAYCRKPCSYFPIIWGLSGVLK